LVAFKSPAHAIAKVLFQVAGEIDYEDIVNQGDLLYNPTTYILLITFLVTMPVLFANLLVSHSSWLDLISESCNALCVIPICPHADWFGSWRHSGSEKEGRIH